MAAEHLGRQWIGIDIWDEAYQTVLNRMAKEGLIVEHSEAQPGQQTLTVANIHYETDPPKRTTTVSRQSFNYELQPEKEQCGFHHQDPSTADCCWILAHTARAADGTTASIRECWKSTT